MRSLPANINIAAVVPTYSNAGDNTTLILKDGTTKIVSNRIKSVISRIAKGQAVDLRVLKSQTRAVIKRTILEPLPIAPGLVLVPVKTRNPRVAGDPTSAYVNLHAVTAVYPNKERPYRATIKLSDKAELPVLWAPATVNRQLILARLAEASAPTTNNLNLSSLCINQNLSNNTLEVQSVLIRIVDLVRALLLKV